MFGFNPGLEFALAGCVAIVLTVLIGYYDINRQKKIKEQKEKSK